MLRGLVAFVPITLFVLANCSSGERTTAPPGDSGDATNANGHAPTCRTTCTTAADCANGSSALEDANHYTCTAGRCEWKGCQSNAECASAAMGGNFVCKASNGSTVPSCVPGCQTPADCVPPNNTNPLADASHFACNAGACEWKGCRHAQECKTGYKSARMACEMTEDATVPSCVPTCTTAADCAIPGAPLSDKSHFACKAGRCEWQGCKSTQDCRSALQTNKVVCE